jgi:hypothetical protein
MRIDLFSKETFWGAEHEREKRYLGVLVAVTVHPDRGGQG